MTSREKAKKSKTTTNLSSEFADIYKPMVSTLDEAPTGDFLAWLQSHAIKIDKEKEDDK